VRQPRVHAPGPVGLADHLRQREAQRLGQALAAVLRRGRQRRPAAFHELLVGFLEALGRGDHAAFAPAAAFLVADPVQRRQHLLAELGAFLEDGLHHVGRGVFEAQFLVVLLVAEELVADELDVAQRSLVFGHGINLRKWSVADRVRMDRDSEPSVPCSARDGRGRTQTTSNRPAAPMPVPTHMVTTTYLAPRRLPSIRAWPVSRAPVMPYGWPTAMAPPLTLRRSSGIPSLSRQYSTCTANASFSSHRSMSSTVRPWRLSSLGTANTGPMPISSGSQPATAKPRKMPSGFRLRRSASLALISTQAEAPSENWLALPAVITPPGVAGRMPRTPSRVVSGRMPSSAETVTSLVIIAPVALSVVPMMVVIGTISSSNLPASRAAAARCWLRAPYSSCASLEML